MRDKILAFLNNQLGVQISATTLNKIITSLVVVIVIMLLQAIILKIAYKYKTSVRDRYYWRKTVAYISTFFILMILGGVWLTGFSNISTFLGLMAAGLAVAFKEPLENIAAWAFILTKRPFDVGDRVQIGQHKGDVIDQRLFVFTLMEIGNWVDAEQSTGRVIHIPNGLVFNEALANYGKGFEYIWNEIPVLITFESDHKHAKKILTGISDKHGGKLSESAEKKVKRAAKKYMIFYQKLTPIVYTSVKSCGVMLTLRYLCEPRQRRTTENDIWEDILTAFSKEKNITLAYPTTRFFDSKKEV